MPCLAMSNTAVWGQEEEEAGTQGCKTRKGQKEQNDAIYLRQEEFFKTLLSFNKTSSSKQDHQWGRKMQPQSKLTLYLAEVKQEIYLEGTQCPPQADGVH